MVIHERAYLQFFTVERLRMLSLRYVTGLVLNGIIGLN